MLGLVLSPRRAQRRQGGWGGTGTSAAVSEQCQPRSSEQRSLSEGFGDGDSVASRCTLLFKVYSFHVRNPTAWAFINFLALHFPDSQMLGRNISP